jgi:tetratricopeptide (TPR) repeat protein
MDKIGLERNHQKVISFVTENKLKDALDALKDLVIQSRRGEYISQYEALDETYENLLKYAIEGIEDPEKDNIYHHLLISVLELADLALQYAYMTDSDKYIYRLKRKIENETKPIKEEAINNIEDLAFDDELSEVLKSQLETQSNEKTDYQNHLNILIKIFNLIWLTDKFKDTDLKLVKSIWEAKNFPWYEQSIIISAITLSAVRCFDVPKIELLIDFSFNKNNQVKLRALVGLFLTLYIHDKRIYLYPELVEQIETLGEVDHIKKNIELIAIQLLKSKDTERITKKFEDEIIPEMVKFQPVLKDKLDLDSILSDDFTDDKNPDWERVFEDAPDLLDKLQEISKMQMEGADVFMSAFSRLKSFEFFNEIINWFRPFHTDNYVINEILKKEEGRLDISNFLDGLSRAFFMCNSDKYSFCLNIQYMPDLQKTLMLEMFNAELDSIRELQKEDEILDQSAHLKSINAQYIQDLYRFFKLHPLRSELLDIFKLKLDFYNCNFFKILVTGKSIFQNIGEFLFERNYYDQALEVYLMLNQTGDNSLEIFEKIGYCYQKLKNYSEALNYYKKAELFEANRAWNLKKLAICNRYLNNHQESLKYYLEVEKLEPDDLYVKTYIGHSYLDLKEYEKALEYYYKVEFLADENKKVLRPIAWCLFVLGNYTKAKEYYERLMVNEANKYDYMNLGHVEWCLGNRKTALKNYKLSLSRDDNNMKSFLTGFEEDKKHLVKSGIDPREINFMLDYLKYL